MSFRRAFKVAHFFHIVYNLVPTISRVIFPGLRPDEGQSRNAAAGERGGALPRRPTTDPSHVPMPLSLPRPDSRDAKLVILLDVFRDRQVDDGRRSDGVGSLPLPRGAPAGDPDRPVQTRGFLSEGPENNALAAIVDGNGCAYVKFLRVSTHATGRRFRYSILGAGFHRDIRSDVPARAVRRFQYLVGDIDADRRRVDNEAALDIWFDGFGAGARG